jgi:hypothetical protein
MIVGKAHTSRRPSLIALSGTLRGRRASFEVREKRNAMVDAGSLVELDQRIAAIRDNIRQLTEQAAALSGAGDEARAADRIAEQERLLAALLKERESLAG